MFNNALANNITAALPWRMHLPNAGGSRQRHTAGSCQYSTLLLFLTFKGKNRANICFFKVILVTCWNLRTKGFARRPAFWKKCFSPPNTRNMTHLVSCCISTTCLFFTTPPDQIQSNWSANTLYLVGNSSVIGRQFDCICWPIRL